MTEIYALNIERQLDESLFTGLLQHVNPEKRYRIRRFLRWEDAHRGLLAELLIRRQIIELTGMNNRDISFYFNEYGKPSLVGQGGFHFNLSHSGIWVVCAIDRHAVGIDVEKVSPIDFGISRNFFNEDEHRDLMSRDEQDRLSYFFTLWTLKESYIKAEGKGLSIPLDSFSMNALDTGNISIRVVDRTDAGRFFKLYQIHRDYKLAICTAHTDFPEAVQMLGLEELISYFGENTRL